MIGSKYLGGGKSHKVKNLSKSGQMILFVDWFFAVPVADGERLPEFAQLFQLHRLRRNLYMNSLYSLIRIQEFVYNQPHKLIIAASDVTTPNQE